MFPDSLLYDNTSQESSYEYFKVPLKHTLCSVFYCSVIFALSLPEINVLMQIEGACLDLQWNQVSKISLH